MNDLLGQFLLKNTPMARKIWVPGIQNSNLFSVQFCKFCAPCNFVLLINLEGTQVTHSVHLIMYNF